MKHPSSEEMSLMYTYRIGDLQVIEGYVATKPLRGTWNWGLLCFSNIGILLKDIKFW